MVTTILNQAIKTASDLKEINKIVRPMREKVCWEASLSYGQELCLEIGEKIPYTYQVRGKQLIHSR